MTRRLATDRFRRLKSVVKLSDARERGLDSDARLRWLDVQAAFEVLTPAQRGALMLVTVIGLDVKEAASVLGTTDNALRASISRARSRLRET